MEKRRRREYTKEFKREAVNLVTKQGYTLSEADRNLGIHSRLLRRWKAQMETEGKDAFPGKGHMSPEQEEIRRLRRENRELRMEREILKKATAFFAKESK
jgi:transposase